MWHKILPVILFLGYLFADDSWKVYDDSEIAVIHITLDPEDFQWIYENVQSDSLHPATVHFQNAHIDETIDSVGFRLRGNTSRNSAKKSFKLDINHFIDGRDFYGLEKLNLNGEHNDPSIVRSKICWDLFQDIGMVSSRAAHAKVFINGDYYGLYISVEHVDDSFLSRNYADDSGNLWKCLWPADLTYRGDDPEDYHPYYDDKRPYELKTNKDEYDFSALARLIRIINQTPDSLELVISMKEVLQYFAINLLTGSWDDYRFLKNNYYIYHEPLTDMFHWIPYDYDNTFSIDWFDIDWSDIDPYSYANHDGSDRPFTEYIFDQSRYKDLFTHFIEFYLTEAINLDLWESELAYWVEWLAPSAEEDIYRTYDYGFSMGDFVDSYGYSYSNQHVQEGIKEFLIQRMNSLETQLGYNTNEPYIYDVKTVHGPLITGSVFNPVAAVFSSGGVETVILHTRLNSSEWQSADFTFSPVTPSKQVEDHDRWTLNTTLNQPGEMEWYLTAISAGAVDRYPVIGYRHISILDQSEVVDVELNELLAINDSINTDAAGEYEDWLELYNLQPEPVILDGYYLTDKRDNLTKWQFPLTGIEIPSDGFLLIWCDEDQGQDTDLHTNFKLSGSGEFLALVAPDGSTIIDSLSFPGQQSDISYGRTDDGSETWTYFEVPTPGSSNNMLSSSDEIYFPTHIQIQSIYPNPFNAASTIQFQVQEPGETILEVYNITGQLIRQEVLMVSLPGIYKWIWDGTDQNGVYVGSGIAMVRITKGNEKATGKLILVK